MFEAYKIGIRISLINQVSSGLILMSRQFSGLNNDAKAFEARLNRIKKLMLFGTAATAVGGFGLGIIGHAMKPAEEYTHQLNILNMAGWQQKEIAEATGVAWKNTRDVMTTTATENLRSILDLKNVLGDFDEAKMALPIVSRIQAVLAASSEGTIRGSSKDLAYSLAKALDIVGAAKNPAMFESQANQMARVIIATQGRVTPEAYKSVFQYARQSKFGLDDVFKYQILPTLMQENATTGGSGGGSRGVGPMLAAFYRWSVQGYINKKSLPELESLGLLGPNSALKTTTKGTTAGSMRGVDMAMSNPFEWVQKILVPAIKHKYGENLSEKDLMFHIGQIVRGNQLAANLIQEFAFKPQNFTRDQRNILSTRSVPEAYKLATANDPNTAGRALSAQWENFKTSLTVGLVPILVPALMQLTGLFNTLSAWGRAHPTLFKDLALGFTALFASLTLGGAAMLVKGGLQGLALIFGAAVWKDLPLIGTALKVVGTGFALLKGGIIAISRFMVTTPLGLLLTALGVAIYELWQHWDVVQPLLLKGWSAIKSGFHALGDDFSTVWTALSKTWDSIRSGFSAFSGWFVSFWKTMKSYIPDWLSGADDSKKSPHIAPPAASPHFGVGDVYLDGHRVGQHIAPHLAKPLGAGMFGGGIDNGVGLPIPGLN